MEKEEQITISLFVALMLTFVLEYFISGENILALIGLAQLGLTIAGFVYSILLIRKKNLGLGITFLILFSILLLIFLLAFFIGFIIGIATYLNEPSATGNAVASLFK